MTTYTSALTSAEKCALPSVHIIEACATDETWIEAIHASKEEADKHARQLSEQNSCVDYSVRAWPLLASAPPDGMPNGMQPWPKAVMD